MCEKYERKLTQIRRKTLNYVSTNLKIENVNTTIIQNTSLSIFVYT